MNSNSPDLRRERYWSFSIVLLSLPSGVLLSLPSGRKISPLGVLLFKVCVYVWVHWGACVRFYYFTKFSPT